MREGRTGRKEQERNKEKMKGKKEMGRKVPTWHGDLGGAADDSAQVVDGGHTLVDALIWLVVNGVLHSADEQRATGEEASALVCGQVEERAVLLPLHPHWILTHHRAVQQSRQTLYS